MGHVYVKYMGSKRWQLQNGLGSELRRVARTDDHFVDLFSGSGIVSWFAAEQLHLKVTGIDLQQYAVVLTGAIIERTRALDVARLIDQWLNPVYAKRERSELVRCSRTELRTPISETKVRRIRRRAGTADGLFVRSYGGYYFSNEQSWTIDQLRTSLPTRKAEASVCLAALIMAASRCSASPGHTAQPFRPTPNALPHIEAVWRRDLLTEVQRSLIELCGRKALNRGAALREDANQFAKQLTGGELVFIDPPYSSEQYSRFYHVLEAIAVGGYDKVTGAGRSPALELRERSNYSGVTSARSAITDLLESLAIRDCRVIATFPRCRASNGLSGEEFCDIATKWYDVKCKPTFNRFSTLGGNGTSRAARIKSEELVLTMNPR